MAKSMFQYPRSVISLLLAIGLGAASALAEEAAPASTTSPQTAPATQPASRPAGDATPEAIALLDKIQARAPDIKSIQADIRYDRIVPLVGDKQRRFGTLLYLTAAPAKFSIHFDRLLVDGRTDKQDRWYIFDGVWLVERLDDKKQFFKRQITKPDAADADPLGSGKGPFIIPLSLKKDRVLARFEASTLPVKDKEPANTTHLLLKPRADSRSEFTEIHIWVSNESLVPVRVKTVNDSGNESVIDLTDIKLNQADAPQTVETAEPKEGGWQVSVTPWSE